jgi:hypothetical protein
VKRRRNRASRRNSVDKGTGDKFGWRISSVDGSEEVDINQVVNKMSTKLERAAGG